TERRPLWCARTSRGMQRAAGTPSWRKGGIDAPLDRRGGLGGDGPPPRPRGGSGGRRLAGDRREARGDRATPRPPHVRAARARAHPGTDGGRALMGERILMWRDSIGIKGQRGQSAEAAACRWYLEHARG